MAGQRERRSTVAIGDAVELNETATVSQGRLWVDVISGGGGGTQYAEDTLHVSGDQVTMAGVVQQTADAALSGNGDRSILQVDETGFLKVNVKTGGTGGTQYVEDSLHVSGDTLTLAGVVQQTADAALSGDGDRSLLQVDGSGFLKVNVKAGATAGTQYTEGDTDASITGTAAMWEDAADTLRPVSATFPLPVNTELPTAAALGDADANPTTPKVGACNQAWNGAAWYRMGGSAANGLEVDITRLPNEGQQTMANSISVAIASDQTAVPVSGTVSVTEPVSVDDNGSSLTVDGSVSISSQVPGTGATNLGKAEDGGHTTGDVGVLALGVRVDVPNAAASSATADYQYVAQDMVGGVRNALYETDFAVLGTSHVKKYYTNAGAVTDGIVWSPAAGKRWYVTDIFINVSAAATVTLEDDLGAGDSPVWKAELAANSGWSHAFTTPLFSGEDAADLLITTSAGNVYVMITGYEI